MKAYEQIRINKEVLENYAGARAAIEEGPFYYATPVRLRSCKARVRATSWYTFLISYNTMVAFIDNQTGIGYDVLRYVYGYTATSAQHIFKFFEDYKPNKILTYRGRVS